MAPLNADNTLSIVYWCYRFNSQPWPTGYDLQALHFVLTFYPSIQRACIILTVSKRRYIDASWNMTLLPKQKHVKMFDWKS